MSKFSNAIHSTHSNQAISGALLGIATLCALFFRNCFGAELYTNWLNMPLFSIHWMQKAHHFNVLEVINEGLMVCFFALVSLEIKKEFLVGVFQDVRYALLPCVAAIGGVIAPAICYLMFNSQDAVLQNGWAIPVATDIAFSLGILSLLGQRVPISLKIFLTTLAIVDDLCAVVIIAVFYANALQWVWLGLSIILLSFLYVLNRFNFQAFIFYFLIGVMLWWTVLQSGVHATIAGVLWAAFIPINASYATKKPALLYCIEDALRPFVNYFVLPIFAFVNAGIPLASMTFESLTHPLFLGVLIGLLVGKPVGILLGSALVIKTGITPLPIGMSQRHLISLAFLGGIGFTMSLLIGMLAFSDESLLILTRQAILISSLLSAALALLIFPKTSA